MPREHRALLEHLRRTGAEGGAWRGVAALVERWQDPASELHDGIEDVWLEFDDRRDAALSVFVGFARTPGYRRVPAAAGEPRGRRRSAARPEPRGAALLRRLPARARSSATSA